MSEYIPVALVLYMLVSEEMPENISWFKFHAMNAGSLTQKMFKVVNREKTEMMDFSLTPSV